MTYSTGRLPPDESEIDYHRRTMGRVHFGHDQSEAEDARRSLIRSQNTSYFSGVEFPGKHSPLPLWCVNFDVYASRARPFDVEFKGGT